MSTIEPYSPAKHGGTVESYQQISRSGTLFLIGSFLFFLLAAVFVIIYYKFGLAASVEPMVLYVLLALTGVLAIAFLFVAVRRLSRSDAFIKRKNSLTSSGNGFVTRGSILWVTNKSIMFGETPFTQAGESLAMDTSWIFKVGYAFEDNEGELRKKTAIIPDLLGPKRNEYGNQTYIDHNMPRVGAYVDVLFDESRSIVLRVVQAS